jgi:hypothetical protein
LMEVCELSGSTAATSRRSLPVVWPHSGVRLAAYISLSLCLSIARSILSLTYETRWGFFNYELMHVQTPGLLIWRIEKFKAHTHTLSLCCCFCLCLHFTLC